MTAAILFPSKQISRPFKLGDGADTVPVSFFRSLQLIKSNLFDNGIAYHLFFLFISIGYGYIS